MDALIGHTGFVGQNLASQHSFAATFNSSNIDDAAGRKFDIVVCAAASATMWAANKDPDGDRAKIDGLIEQLRRIAAGRFVLISTIAVLDTANAGYTESLARYEREKAYGRNRRALETAIESIFPQSHILRLPALFGRGLKKNFLFDILHPTPSFLTPAKLDDIVAHLPPRQADLVRDAYRYDDALAMYAFARDRYDGTSAGRSIEAAFFQAGFTALNFVNPESTYQYYGLDALWSDIRTCIKNDLTVMHLATEPLRAGDIYATLTGESLPTNDASLYYEDMRTEHGRAWGTPGPYIESGEHVLSQLKQFYTAERRAA